jgi:HEAT repeat protein
MKPLVIVALVVVGALAVIAVLLTDPTENGTEGPGERTSSRPLTLPEARTEAWRVLTDLANDIDEEIRGQTIEVIVGIDDSRAVKYLQKGMEDAEAIVRVRTAGLHALRGRKDLVPFVRALAKEDDDWDTFTEAARAYGRIGTPDAVPLLVAILTGADLDVDEDAQNMAALWLARLGAREAIPALRSLLDDDEEVALPAAAALLALGETDVLPKLLEGVEDDETDIIAPALDIPGNKRVVGLLERIVRYADGFDDERGMAALSLAGVGTPEAIEALGTLWEGLPEMRREEGSDLAEVTAYLAAALALTGDGRGADRLEDAATCGDTDLSLPALKAAARLGRGVSLEALTALMAPPGERAPNESTLARAWAARAVLAIP